MTTNAEPDQVSRRSPKKPVLSLVTVCRNAESTLHRTIASVARQKVGELEYIVVDGSSSDRTIEIIEEWAAEGIIDHWISEPDAGIYDAMNKGVRFCSGDYVCLLNADDQLADGAIITALAAADNYPDYFFGDNDVVLEDGTLLHDKLPPFRLANETMCCHQALWVRKDVIDSLGGYDTTVGIAADQDFMIRLVDRYPNGQYTGKTLCVFHLGGRSGSTDYARSERNIRISLVPEIRRYCNSHTGASETFAYYWTGRLLDWLRTPNSAVEVLDYLIQMGKSVGLGSIASVATRCLFWATFKLLTIFGVSRFSRLPIRILAITTHLTSRHKLRRLQASQYLF